MPLRGALMLAGLVVALLAAQVADAKIVIRLGTLAPKGSPWHDAIMQMNADWQRISGGEVTIKVYSGVLGGEPEMIRKMRLKEIHAVALSGAGLATIDRSISAFQLPLMFESYAELDYVRDRIAPQLEAIIAERQQLKTLNWSDAGWVHFFAIEPVRTPEDISQLRLLTSAGDPDMEALYKEFGYRVVPLPYTDVLMSLQTGLIEAVQGPPLFALLEQWFGIADYMVPVKWAPLVGATLMRMDTWNEIPPQWQGPMLEASRRAGNDLRDDIRKLGDDAIPEMQKRGLTVVELGPADMALWREEADNAYGRLRGTFVPPELFDEVKRLRDEYRHGNAAR
jgi:TRAP-type C4-dicarboxylate transport system substrate-binding protein